MEGLASNNTTFINGTEIFTEQGGKHPMAIAMITLYFIMLTLAILSCLLLTYITYRHGYGSRLNNFLVTNWILFMSVFLITGSILHFFLQFIARIPWPLGISGCVVTQFLENITVLPLKTIPVVLCISTYIQVFDEKKAGLLSKISSTIWVTAAVWIIVFDCVLGSMYRGQFVQSEHIKIKKCFHDIAFEEGPVYSIHLLKVCFEIVWGSVVPLIAIITIGVFTAKQTKGGMPLPKSVISEKLKVRELILAVMGLTIICRLTTILFLGSSHGKNLLLHWLLSITLALVCCHREFWKSVFDRFKNRSADDMQNMLS